MGKINMELEKKLIKILINSNAFDIDNVYINFDKVWQNPQYFIKCGDIITDFIFTEIKTIEEKLNKNIKPIELVLVTPDFIRPTLGITPFIIYTSSKIGCHFAVWKEIGDLKWGSSELVGPTNEKLICICIQDVVRNATTLLRMMRSIENTEWDITAYLGLVKHDLNVDNGSRNKIFTEIEEIIGKKVEINFLTSINKIKSNRVR